MAKFRSCRFMNDKSGNSDGSSELDKSRGDISRPDRQNSPESIWTKWLIQQKYDKKNPAKILELIQWNYTPYTNLPILHPKRRFKFGDELPHLNIIRNFDKFSYLSGDLTFWGTKLYNSLHPQT